ncbi:MAG: alpha/beta hydrolase [Alkalinema sp. CACIAM 70d]|nr:MAG: alpha/beta hydrolase [Alkalinema sp. CACIAM 70d]
MTVACSETTPYQIWEWQGFEIGYQTADFQSASVQSTSVQNARDRGPAVLLIHGFGASCYHWRKNIPVLAQTCRVYALDLIGFGRSAKPTPNQEIAYTFETWSQQIRDFCREVIGTPVFLVGNSIGCVAAMQAAVDEPDQVRGVVLLNCSLRLLHDRKREGQPWYKQLGAPILQSVLQNKAIGQFFFNQIAQPQAVKNILRQAYHRPEAVTDELVEYLLAPARDPGAVDVFLAFTAYSQGPLPEDLLPQLTCPTLVVWGEEDPWEPISLGRAFSQYPAVEQFIALPSVGHCPQDEAPELVNPIVQDWIQTHL